MPESDKNVAAEIVFKPHTWFKPHPKNQELFGAPDKDLKLLEDVVTSIAEQGLQEPLVALPDGTILSGHLRHHAIGKVAALDDTPLDQVMVPTRIQEPFKSSGAELSWLIDANIRRRQLSRRQIGILWVYLDKLEGTPKLDKPRKGRLQTLIRQQEAARAKKLGTTPERAKNLATIYGIEGVPEEVKTKVERGKIAEGKAARAIANSIRKGIVNPERVKAKVKELEETPEPVKPMEEYLTEAQTTLKEGLQAPPKDGVQARAILGAMMFTIRDALARVPAKQRVGVPLCSVCREPQFMTPSGMTCIGEGHGGAPSIYRYQDGTEVEEDSQLSAPLDKETKPSDPFDVETILKSL